MRNEILRRRVRTLRLMQAHAAHDGISDRMPRSSSSPMRRRAVVIGLIAWVIADHAAQRRLLAELEARGVTRRSDEDAA